MKNQYPAVMEMVTHKEGYWEESDRVHPVNGDLRLYYTMGYGNRWQPSASPDLSVIAADVYGDGL